MGALVLKSFKSRVFSPKFHIFGRQFCDKKKIIRQLSDKNVGRLISCCRLAL